MTPYEYTVVELSYVAGNSDKFYRAYLDMQTGDVFYQFGKNTWTALHIGSWTEPKNFGSVEKGHEKMMAQVRSKIAKGYEIVRTTRITCAQKVAYPSMLAQLLSRTADPGPLVLANV